MIFHPQNDTYPVATVTLNWGDGGPLAQTVYNSGVTSDTYYHNYPYVGNYTVSVSVCDTIGNCNSTTLLHYDYQQTFTGQVGQLLFNTNPSTPTTSILTNIANDLAQLGATILGAVIEILAAAALLFFGVIFGLGYARKHGYIK